MDNDKKELMDKIFKLYHNEVTNKVDGNKAKRAELWDLLLESGNLNAIQMNYKLEKILAKYQDPIGREQIGRGVQEKEL